jgi:hypothetical protein
MDCPQDSSSLLFTTWLNSEFGATSNLDLFEVERPGDVPEDNSPEPSSYFGNGQGGMGYSLSPDGSLIAVTGAEQITFIERSSQAVVSSHAFPPVATFSESRYAPTVTWNPGAPSAWVVVPMPPENFQVDATTTIWKVYVDGRPAEALDTFITGAPLVARTWVSPDLLWSAHIDQSQADGTHVELRLSPVGGGAGIPIARGEVEFFGWSAGSRHFLYQEDRDGDLLLGQVGDPPAAGKTSFGPGIQGAWVNEQQFLYVAKMGDAFELRLANIDGTWQSISGQSTGEISFAASPGGDTRP